MRETFNIPGRTRLLALLLTGLGVVALIIGFVTDQPRTWTSLLLNNFYFLSLALGAVFFVALQYVTDSGWPAMFKRIPEAMASFVPVAFVVMLALFAGMNVIYEWAEPGITERDALIAHKSPYLNIPFFFLRMVVLFSLWILLIFLMRRHSLNQDTGDGIAWFKKSRHYSMVFIFVFAVTFTVASFDWIMSIDSHWFSTLFGIRAIVSSLYYAVAVMILLILSLNRAGYLEALNKYHLNDFSRYLFRLSIVFGYLWFMQYFIIWYANIPETTFYYVYRVNQPWTFLFYAELIINWTIPFLVLMSDDAGRRKAVLIPVSILLLAGFYISLYIQIIPGSTGELRIGFIELGSFAGFAGLFILIFMHSLAKAPLLAVKHPFMNESLDHHI